MTAPGSELGACETSSPGRWGFLCTQASALLLGSLPTGEWAPHPPLCRSQTEPQARYLPPSATPSRAALVQQAGRATTTNTYRSMFPGRRLIPLRWKTTGHTCLVTSSGRYKVKPLWTQLRRFDAPDTQFMSLAGHGW